MVRNVGLNESLTFTMQVAKGRLTNPTDMKKTVTEILQQFRIWKSKSQIKIYSTFLFDFENKT